MHIPEKPAAGETVQGMSEEEMFREAMSRVREIKDYRVMPVERKRDIRVSKREEGLSEMKMLEEITRGQRPIDLQNTQEYISWRNPDCRENITEMLHQGHFSVQDFLDLHGMTVGEAETELHRFLRDSIRRGLCCVKIIHGRGLRSPNGPVLKKELVKWLTYTYRKNVISFVTARQCDGGLGAVYVLLRTDRVI
ncbi:MAG: Smr/MutS family protein [bacterium]